MGHCFLRGPRLPSVQEADLHLYPPEEQIWSRLKSQAICYICIHKFYELQKNPL